MKTIDVVGIGISTVDIIVRLTRLPTWETPTEFDDIIIDSGGPTGTALCTASKLGASVGFVGTAGNDWFSEYKLESFQTNGVDISHVKRRKFDENQIVVVNVDEHSGERIFNRSREFYSNQLHIHEINKDYITQAKYLLIDGYHFDASIKAAKWMHQTGNKVIFDGAATKETHLDNRQLRLVSSSDYLICGSGYAEALTGYREIEVAGRAALDYGPEVVVITVGEDGSHLFNRNSSFHTPAFDVPVIDTTGAGDAFHGAFAYGLLQGWELGKICTFTSAVSAIECMTLGGRKGLPTLSQVKSFLKDRGFNL